MKFSLVWGTRPEIIKMAPIVKYLQKINAEFIIIDTNQHFDYEMSQIFYNELELPDPNYRLELPRSAPPVQVSYMIKELHAIFTEENPSICLAQGDTNTVMAAALTSAMTKVPFGHVEAGIRSFDMTMPEELNRKIAGDCANLHFSPTSLAVENLLGEGKDRERIILSGNTIVDSIDYIRKKIQTQQTKDYRKEFGWDLNSPLIPVTLHRPSNVDNPKILLKILKTLADLEANFLFLTHPRTMKNLESHNLIDELNNSNIKFRKSFGYFDFINLLLQSEGVITDSGGIQEECTCLGIPSITLRANTERPESVWDGKNRLLNPHDPDFRQKMKDQFLDFSKITRIKSNPFGDGRSSERIVETCLRTFISGKLNWEMPDFTLSYPKLRLLRQVGELETIQIAFDGEGNIYFTNQDKKSHYYLVREKKSLVSK